MALADSLGLHYSKRSMNLDRLAPVYRAMELLAAGGKLQCCRTAFLPEVPVPGRVLLVGEGHGRFLPECVRRFPNAEIVVLDSSRRMLEIARSRVDSERVEFVHADLLDWQPPRAGFDLVVTQFVLDCLTAEELAVGIGKLETAAAPRANWLLADFELAPAGMARLRSRVVLALLYRFFRIVSGLRAHELVSPDPGLESAGFRKNARRTYEWGLLKSEWWVRESGGHLSSLGPCEPGNPGL